MLIRDDPYFAGRIASKSGEPVDGPPPVLPWIGVYAVNLILPVWLGLMRTRDGGRIGMLLGIIAVFALGCRLCFVSREPVLTVVYGGWIVAASQFAPFLQILAGLIGVGAARAMSRETGNVDTVLGGFIATSLTGGILIAVAAAFGLVIRSIVWVLKRIT